MSKIIAVIVTFYPDKQTLANLLTRLKNQVDHILVVDNNSNVDVTDYIHLPVTLFRLDQNSGVGVAVNQGIRYAVKNGYTHALLFDQDSLPAQDMVQVLERALASAVKIDSNTAAVGPRCVDNRQETTLRFHPLPRGPNRLLINRTTLIPVMFLITSGTLLPLSIIDAVGVMEENLFIDYIDVEWGLRAWNQGYVLWGVDQALMYHRPGDSPLHILGKKFQMHAPLRHYYQMRNALWVYRHAPGPPRWKICNSLRLGLRYIGYALFTGKEFREHIKMMSLGLFHGIIGKTGKWTR